MAKRLVPMAEPPATLPDVEKAVWRELADAVFVRGHGWRQATLATTDGAVADARTVILREVDAGAKTVRFYTDSRSAKVAQIAALPRGTLLLWSAMLGWQLRLRVALEVDGDSSAATTRWERIQATPAAQDYRSPLPPGSPRVEAPDLPELETSVPPAHTAVVERTHFALVIARIEWVDWLELHESGQRRARFDADGARWLVP